MAKVILNDGDLGSVFRGGLNTNFTELYTGHGVTQTASISGATVLDFSAYKHFILTLTGVTTLSDPTTETVGQSGIMVFVQDGVGSQTVSLGTQYETVGAGGLTLSTAANAVDIVPYIVRASGSIVLGVPTLGVS